MIKIQFLKKNIVKENKTLLDVIQSLNGSEEKICIISNNKNKVRGVITDGDLRRILLKQNDLKVKIRKYFKKKFIFLKKKETFKDAKNKFLKHKDII